jgi:hypothetical protein
MPTAPHTYVGMTASELDLNLSAAARVDARQRLDTTAIVQILLSSASKTAFPGGYTDIVEEVGSVSYLLDNELHREDGPAYISAEGDEHYYLNGFRHRKGAPAIITRNSAEFWYCAGQLQPTPAS